MTLQDLMVQVRGNQTEAARMLGLTRNTIKKYIKLKVPNVIIEHNGNLVLLAPVQKRGNAD